MRSYFRLAAALLCAANIAAETVPFELTVLKENSVSLFAVADIDNDGKNDIVSASSPPLFWYRYPDWKTFPIETSGGYGMEIHAVDIDKDGYTDVCAPQDNSRKIYWWKNPLPDAGKLNSAWQKFEVGTYPEGFSHDFKTGDLNGDGKIDMVVSINTSNKPFYIYIQQNPTTWHYRTVGNSEFEGIWLADLDGDGDDDIVDGKYWIESPADPIGDAWTIHQINSYSHPKRRACVADFNKDGRLDVITATAEFGAGPLEWYEAPQNPKTGTWIRHPILPSENYNFHTLQTGDINLDDRPDFIVGSTHHSGHFEPFIIRAFYNKVQADTVGWEEQKWNTPKGVWQGVLADIGSDGDLDLIAANYDGSSAQHELWENKLDPTTGTTGAEQLLSRRDGAGRSLLIMMHSRTYLARSLMYTVAGRQMSNASCAGRKMIMPLIAD